MSEKLSWDLPKIPSKYQSDALEFGQKMRAACNHHFCKRLHPWTSGQGSGSHTPGTSVQGNGSHTPGTTGQGGGSLVSSKPWDPGTEAREWEASYAQLYALSNSQLGAPSLPSTLLCLGVLVAS